MKNKKSKLGSKRKPVYKPIPGQVSRFPKGVSGNPNGRPKGSKNRFSIAELADAIASVEQKKKKGFLEHWVESAWIDGASAMDSVVQYMLPKLKSIEGVIATFESSMSDEMAKAIQNKLAERYK